MFRRSLVVGVRQLTGGLTDPTAENAIRDLGHNTGNMMFTESLCKLLTGARWGSFGFKPEDLHDRDSIVLASANWINDFEDFGWLADRLETTTLPVFLVGVGAQASLKMEMPTVRPGTQRLLDLVRDRSTSIAARGGFSCEVLEKLGVKTAVETGCPSLMLAGVSGPTIDIKEMSRETCAVHSTRHGVQQTDQFQRWLYSQAFKQQLNLVLQSELSDIYLTLGSVEADHLSDKGLRSLRESYNTEDMDAIRGYLRTYGHVFLNYPDWIAFMKTRTLCFGTRIHGTVASLIAGIPATLICHDSRTLEMARSMSIPMVLSTAVDIDKELSMGDFFLPDETLNFSASYKKYYARYLAYFAANDLLISPEFDEEPVINV
jgi:hypothetical protein